MREIDRISNQMARALEGEAWHGPSLTELLEGVDAAAAAAKPIPAAHSIWEIVLHLIGTQELVLARMQGEVRTLTPDEDWPSVRQTTQRSWEAAVRKLAANDERMRKRMRVFTDEMLDQPLVKGGSSVYDNLHGTIQHNLYHAGQIAILRKQLL
jgi:uncharacterized damage-inducible protein DinB